MITLNPEEARVLGVLVEKSLTTPNQYPLSLNAVVDGANQKSNRFPVLNLTEDQCFDALELLREKQLVVRVDQVGARVHKFKHAAVEVLHIGTTHLAVLTELLLRGPQTLGELRGRASRMAPIATLDDAKQIVRSLIERDEPFVKELPPQPGSRAECYAQLLAPDAHDIAASAAQAPSSSSDSLADRIEKLEQEVMALREIVEKFAPANPSPANR